MRLDSDIALALMVIATNVWVLCIGIQQLINMRRVKKLEQKVERWMESEIDKAKATQKKDEAIMEKKSHWFWNPSKRGKIVIWTICLVIWIPLLWFYGILDFGVLDFREKRDEVHPFDQAFDTKAWRQREAEKRAYQNRRYADRLRDAGQRIAARAEEVRMEKWKANFPYRPTTDPAVMRDPEVNYSTLDGPGPPYMENVRMAIRDNHNYLSGFYADDVLYTVQFEKMYGILAEYGRTNNPVMVGRVFEDLWLYQNPEKTRWSRSKMKESIAAELSGSHWLNPHYYTDAGEEESREIAERLIEEIEGMDSLPRPFYGNIHDDDPVSYFDRLKLENPELVGDFLVPYEGWTEEYEEWQKSQHKQFLISLTNGDPSFKSVFPEYFPPVDIKDNKLVDRDGDPIVMSEEDAAFYIRGVTPRGEVIPFFWEEDGTVRVPTPAEIEEMLANGEIEVLTEEEAQEIRIMPPKPSLPTLPEQAAPLTPEQELLLDIIKEQIAE